MNKNISKLFYSNDKLSSLTHVIIIFILILIISSFHYMTPTMKWQYHLIYMQAYFIPIIYGAFQFGTIGGVSTALAVSAAYFPHIMMHWGGLIENNLMRFLQILLFYFVGYFTGLKAQGEKSEKEKYQEAANNLEKSYKQLIDQSEKISEMEQQLREADRLSTVGELAASLAHEVRNPLGSIRGAVDIIRNVIPDEKKEKEFLDILIQDTERLNRVVENYLRFSKKQDKAKTEFDIFEIVDKTILMVTPQAKKTNASITRKYSVSSALAWGNPDELWQVLMNIILNAISSMENGGDIFVEITLKEKPEKKITEIETPGIVEINIRDTGKGIAEENLKEIFDTFYTTKQEGTGLGLAIVKRICKENNWEIHVDSATGKGTSFSILIPVKV